MVFISSECVLEETEDIIFSYFVHQKSKFSELVSGTVWIRAPNFYL